MLLLAALAGLVASGCGKGELVRRRGGTGSAHASVARARSVIGRDSSGQTNGRTRTPRSSPRPPRLDVPLEKLSAPPSVARAAAFSRAVNLRLADVTGAHADRRTPDKKRTDEARECERGTARVIGGAESRRFTRGKGLEREVISSGVAVLTSEALAREDVASVTSRAGIDCYAAVVRHSLGHEEDGLRIADLRVARLQVPLAGRGRGVGIRISVRITELRTGASIPLFIDSLVFVHQAAELELYASSYVQPEPLRTEQELLDLMEERARLSRL